MTEGESVQIMTINSGLGKKVPKITHRAFIAISQQSHSHFLNRNYTVKPPNRDHPRVKEFTQV